MHEKQTTGNNEPVKMSLGLIRTDGGTQARASLDQEAVTDYAEAYRQGGTLPPVIVYHDGQDSRLADGFHRVEAAKQAGFDDITADVRQGTRRDAALFACGANRKHGVRPTRADKRRAVERMLADEEWSGWSDRRIAAHCGPTHPFVAKVRAEMGSASGNVTRCAQRGGQTYTVNVENIGKSQEERPAPQIPLPPLNPGKAYTWISAEDIGPVPIGAYLEIAPSDTSGFWRYALTYLVELPSGEIDGWQDLSVRGIRLTSPDVWRTITERLGGGDGHWTEMEPDQLKTESLVGEEAKQLRRQQLLHGYRCGGDLPQELQQVVEQHGFTLPV